jgi:uncharacterized membrane protein YeaQ/YmgE (transglycosylase-associated protein family)
MSIIGWIIIGFLAGWLAGVVTGTGKRFGCCMDVVVGIIGAFVGGFIFSYIQNEKVTFRFDLWSFFVAFVGAVVLLLIFRITAWLVAGRAR